MKFRALIVAFVLPLTLVTTAHAAPANIIGIAYDTGGLGDQSYNDAAAAGIKLAKKNVQIISVVTDGSAKNRDARVRSLIAKGADHIVAIGSGYAPTISKLAIEYPNIQFAMLNDGSVEGVNVTSLVFADVQGAYLAGVAAALSSKSGKVGMIALPNQGALFTDGFSAGVAASKKKVKATIQYSPVNWAAAARALIAAGNDVIYISVSGSVADVFTEVVKANRSKKSVGLITAEPDQYLSVTNSTKRYLYAIVEKRADHAVRDFINASINDELFLEILDPDKGIYGRRYGIKGGGLEITLHLPSLASQTSAINAAAAVAEKIPA